MANVVKTLRLGMNRGNPRLWLEGATLSNAGFVRGARYDCTIGANGITFELNAEGKRRVSGKAKANGEQWPIIDMNGANLGHLAGADLTLTANVPAGRITIVKVEA